MNQILEEISNIGVVPVVAIDHKDDAAPLADALTKGGLPCAEVTFRTPAAEESIRIMANQFPDMLLGAGTVLTTEQADRAIAAGAKFIVSPGFNPKVVSHCIEKNIPITPGISSPSDMEQAIEMGLDAVKFFPAVPSGGLSMIKALAAPYHTMRFMPTGAQMNMEGFFLCNGNETQEIVKPFGAHDFCFRRFIGMVCTRKPGIFHWCSSALQYGFNSYFDHSSSTAYASAEDTTAKSAFELIFSNASLTP